jgi:hypothetical protein
LKATPPYREEGIASTAVYDPDHDRRRICPVTDEVARLVAAWTPEAVRGSSDPPAGTTLVSPGDEVIAIRRVLEGIHGEKSRQLLRYLAEAGLKGETVKLSEALVREFGVNSGTAFAGMIRPVNRRAGRIMGRLLIGYPSADPTAKIWQISPADAAAVLEALEALEGE